MPTLVVPSASSLAIILMAILYPMLQGMVIFGLATCLFGILSGGGLAMFYAVIAMIPEIAETAGVHGMLITLPMQMIANLSRTISPVAAVIMIVASTVGVSPTRILKRTAVPSIVAIILVMAFSVIFLPY